MNKKILFSVLGGILIIVVIVIFVALGKNATPPTTNESSNTETGSLGIQTQEELNSIYAQAGLKGDITICDQIRDPSLRSPCQDNVFYSLAIAKKDIKICDQLKAPQRDQCIEVVSGLK